MFTCYRISQPGAGVIPITFGGRRVIGSSAFHVGETDTYFILNSPPPSLKLIFILPSPILFIEFMNEYLKTKGAKATGVGMSSLELACES